MTTVTEKTFDLTISKEELSEIAPDLLDCLREFVQSGLCRMSNQFERNYSARDYATKAKAALKKFPQLKLNHMGSKTIITE